MIRVVLSPLFAGQRQQVTSPIGRPEIWERAQSKLDALRAHLAQGAMQAARGEFVKDDSIETIISELDAET